MHPVIDPKMLQPPAEAHQVMTVRIEKIACFITSFSNDDFKPTITYPLDALAIRS